MFTMQGSVSGIPLMIQRLRLEIHTILPKTLGFWYKRSAVILPLQPKYTNKIYFGLVEDPGAYQYIISLPGIWEQSIGNSSDLYRKLVVCSGSPPDGP